MSNPNRKSCLMKISYKWKLIIILWVVFFFNQADRQIFNVVLSQIRDDLYLTDSQMGLISTSFLIVYGLLVPIAGVIGDKYSKKKVIVVSLLIWTTATLLTGLSQTVMHFILLRCIAMGGGEAFYSPSANAMISESHKKSLSTALSLHQTALYFGVILSSYITGLIAEQYGWRAPFYIFGSAGFILALIVWFYIKDHSKFYKDFSQEIEITGDKPAVSKPTTRETIAVFFKKPTAILLALAFAGMQFVGMGFLTWMPTYLHESFNLNLSKAGFDSTFYYKCAAFIAILFGGKITDYFVNKNYNARLWTQSIGLFIGVPALFLMGNESNLIIVYITMFVYGLAQGLYDSNIFASLYDVIEPPYRATATGIMLSFAFVVGATSPLVLGTLKPYIGLSDGISWLSFVLLISSLLIYIAKQFFFKRDRVSLV